MKQRMIRIFCAIICFTAFSCSRFQAVIKDESWENRFNAAIAYYEKGDFFRAGVLLDDLVPILRGSKEAEKAHFYQAYCYFKQRQYQISGGYFKTFHDTYNRSEFAQESFYMYAYSLYSDSPPAHLDQESSETAIEAFQEFINRYPQSSYAKQAANMMSELRQKLEFKAFKNAKLYQNLRRYKSAVIAYENFQKDYPDSYLQEETAFRRIESQYELARQSYQNKQKERYEKTLEFYQYFIDKYPNSTYIKQAENFFDNAQKQIKLLM